VNTRIFALFAALLLAADLRANANSITPTLIRGDNDHLRAEFLVQWDPLPLYGEWISNGFPQGTWSGGSWAIGFDVKDMGVSSGGVPDGGWLTCVLRTTWNDGWAPGAIGPDVIFPWGALLRGPASLVYERPPMIAHDFSGLGLQYYLFAGSWLDITTSPNRSGSGRFAFELIRVSAVPETGSTLLLLGAAASGLLLLRARARK
jgi:hypothetical protein